MRTRFARVLSFSAALLTLTFGGSLRAQVPGNLGRQVEGQLLNNAASAVTGQPAAAPAPPAAAVPAPPAAGVPTTPGQALQGVERQVINNATTAVTGQPAATPAQPATRYQLPTQFTGSAPGSTVNYAGTNYTVNADGTMSPATTQAAANAARYQLPTQFAGSAPGSTVNYGGTNYTVNADGTMTPAAAAGAQPAATGLTTNPRQVLQGMERQAVTNAAAAVTGQPAVSAARYQLPAQFTGSAPGSTVNYGGANYTVNADGTMSPAAAPGIVNSPRRALQNMERQTAYTAVTGQPAATRYQLPAQFAGTAPGSTVNYGGTNYTVNADGTMSPAAGTAAQPAANAARYQIPAQFAGSAPGSTVNYGGTNYVINNDNTMSPAAR